MKTKASKENVGLMTSKTKREPFKALQATANDKTNIAGRVMVYKDAKRKHTDMLCKNCTSDLKRNNYVDKAVQAGEKPITPEDLTNTDEPSAEYWRQLAETRGKALDESLEHNIKLQEFYDSLQEENKKCNEMLNESRNMVELLQEILAEDDEDEPADETPNCA